VIAPGLSQAQLLVLEKPGNALPSPISLPTQPNALRSRISAYYLLTPLSVRSLSKIAHILQIDCAGSVTLCSVTASFMTCYLRKTTEAPAISTQISRVACFVATAVGVNQVTITSTLRRTSSAASSGSRLICPSADRNSNRMFCPSIYPRSRSPRRNSRQNSSGLILPITSAPWSAPSAAARAPRGATLPRRRAAI
jgi:hypothetical protein